MTCMSLERCDRNNESKIEIYAYNVLKDYREDGGKKCL